MDSLVKKVKLKFVLSFVYNLFRILLMFHFYYFIQCHAIVKYDIKLLYDVKLSSYYQVIITNK